MSVDSKASHQYVVFSWENGGKSTGYRSCLNIELTLFFQVRI